MQQVLFFAANIVAVEIARVDDDESIKPRLLLTHNSTE